MAMKRAVLVLSGGLDSTTLLAYVRSKGFQVVALSCQYGQRNAYELAFARYNARLFQVAEHIVFPLPLDLFGGSALTDSAIPVQEPNGSGRVPNTYVPARNILFLSLAASLAESRRIRSIFIGINAIDFSGYPDCRPEFLDAFRRMINIGTRMGIEQDGFCIEAPFINKRKQDIIATGLHLGVDYGKTFSCYNPRHGKACMACDSCLLRQKAFHALGIYDTRLIMGGEL